LTLVNYWLDIRPENGETPDLWKASAQPVSAVKEAVGVFVEMITHIGAGDRVGLVVYNSPSQEALLEQALTDDFELVEDIIDQRQAGHYDTATNIGAGIQRAIQELDENAREYAGKTIILMTDGIANTPRNTRHARWFALEQAQMAADKACRITTISLGREADTELMQQIADMTGGIHFHIPTGNSIDALKESLKEVFRRIAFDGRTILVK
jgi:Mg-chelatase subunit ChlD